MKTLLVLDNYDSFTYNLVQVFKRHPLHIHVFRSDKITLREVRDLAPDFIVISPGPGTPEDSGISRELIRSFYTEIPLLGVCLGMQCINEVFGGRTIHAPQPVHGKVSLMDHDGTGILQGLPQPAEVARYHSLMTQAVHEDLIINGRTGPVPLSFRHRNGLLHGVQFHPESFMTPRGEGILDMFLKLAPKGERAGKKDVL